MEAWAQDPQLLLPKEVLLQANVAAVQAIGPAYLQQHLEQQQIDELTAAVEALKEADTIGLVRWNGASTLEHQLAEAKERKAKAHAKLAEALVRMHAVMLASAEAISPGLVLRPPQPAQRRLDRATILGPMQHAAQLLSNTQPRETLPRCLATANAHGAPHDARCARDGRACERVSSGCV